MIPEPSRGEQHEDYETWKFFFARVTIEGGAFYHYVTRMKTSEDVKHVLKQIHDYDLDVILTEVYHIGRYEWDKLKESSIKLNHEFLSYEKSALQIRTGFDQARFQQRLQKMGRIKSAGMVEPLAIHIPVLEPYASN